MSSNIKIGDDAVHVPRLKLGGSNWVLYKDRLLWAADAKGYRGHLDGLAREPIAPQATAAQAAGTAAPGAVAGPATAGGDAGATAGGTGGGTGTAGPTGGTVGAGGTPGAVVTATGVTPDQAQVTYEATLSEWRKGQANIKQLIVLNYSAN
ncbi:hypothetical protein BD414DRAFT_499823 [Trametes punicea]|nr:hypothetical protein BD414DRAFT_499823 [Trametes punicea]